MNKKISLLLALAMCGAIGLSASACETAGLSDAGVVSDAISASENSTEPDVVIGTTTKSMATIHQASIAELNAFNEETIRVFDVSNGFHVTGDPSSIDEYDVVVEDAELVAAYTFTALESVEEAQASKYAEWHADFYVSVNKSIAGNTLGLAGQYDLWSDMWVAFFNPAPVEANQEFGLLASMAGYPWTYVQVVEGVKEFNCGVFLADDAVGGFTVTVKLVLTNPNNAEERFVVSTTEYKF